MDRGGPAAPGTSPGGDAGRSFKSHFGNPVGGPHDRFGLGAFFRLRTGTRMRLSPSARPIWRIGFARIVAMRRA
jgi:hypothetical protein